MTETRKLCLLGLVVLGVSGCAGTAARDADVLYQVSTIAALLEGVYDGEVTIAALKTRGDVGLGTFGALDGEMVVLDGTVYQVTADGRARVAPDDLTTPFAAVTPFESDLGASLDGRIDLRELQLALDLSLPSRNLIYAVKVTGEFAYVKVRSVPRQEEPYRKLTEVVKAQPVFEHRDVRGTLVGLRMPAYVKGINVPGYHFHFLTEDRTEGGHVLDCILTRGRADIDTTFALDMALPRDKAFAEADLAGDRQNEVHAVEK